MRNKCHGTNSWAALEHGVLSPHWESKDSQQPVFKGPAIVQTEEPILKTCGPGKEGGGKSGSAATWSHPPVPNLFSGTGQATDSQDKQPLGSTGTTMKT